MPSNTTPQVSLRETQGLIAFAGLSKLTRLNNLIYVPER